MKKHLLSTSAIALGVAMAAPASAQEWNLDFGGFYKGYVGVSDVGGSGARGQDFDGVDVFNDGELHFDASIALDNGLTVGADVEIELINSGDRHIDESSVYITGEQLGFIRIGQDNSAGYQSMTGAPTVTSIWINSPSSSAFIPRTGNFVFRQAAISSFTEVEGGNDVPRVSYFTPSFNGLVVGVSYTPDSRPDRSRNFARDRNRSGSTNDVFDIGASYNQSFGTVDLTLTGRWGIGDRTRSDDVGPLLTSLGITDDGGDPTTWGLGARVGFEGWTFGGSYTENGRDISGTNAGDQEGWSLGVTYDVPGPWSLEALTVQGAVKNGAGNPDSDYEAYRVGAARNLGPGVNWELFYIYSETNNGAAVAGVDGATVTNPKIDGNTVGTGIILRF